jgi:hypothetical protein
MEKFECDNCNKKFTNKRNFKNHLEKKICFQKKRFYCGICGETYKKRWNLRCHLLDHNINKEEISNYININKDVKPIEMEKSTCPLCNKEFASKNNMKKHLKRSCLKNKQATETNNITNNNNFTNNGTYNNITNNITYNLNLNITPFGEEKIDHEKLLNIIEKINVFNHHDLVKKIIKEKHINTPENRNVFVNYKFGKIAIVLDKKDMKWKKCEKDDVYKKIRYKVIDDIDECMHQNKTQNILVSNQMKKLGCSQNKKINKKYYEDVNSLLFNNKNILEKSYKNSVGN